MGHIRKVGRKVLHYGHKAARLSPTVRMVDDRIPRRKKKKQKETTKK